jgi:hypothetical protein
MDGVLRGFDTGVIPEPSENNQSYVKGKILGVFMHKKHIKEVSK